MAIREKLYPQKIIPYTHACVLSVPVYAYAGVAGALSLLFSFGIFSAIPKKFSIHHSQSHKLVSTTLSPTAIKEANDAIWHHVGVAPRPAICKIKNHYFVVISEDSRKFPVIRLQVCIYSCVIMSDDVMVCVCVCVCVQRR